MHKINTTTKKFSEAVTIDLGQLPTVDTRIDFILTDGSKPVIAENKTFAMTIGTVNGELYKTDDDTVSYRYLKFDDNNVADSLAITMKMNGEEILNDTVSLTYQTSEGIDTSVLDKKLDAPATPGTVGQVLTKTADGQEWADAPAGGEDPDVLDALDNLNYMLESHVGAIDDKDFFHVTALEDGTFTYRGMDTGNQKYEYSFDRRKWYEVILPFSIFLEAGKKIWLRNTTENLAFDITNKPIVTHTGAFSVGGKILSLASKSIDETATFGGGLRMHSVFEKTNITAIDTGFTIPTFVPMTSNMFSDCTSLASLPDGFTIPDSVTNVDYMFRGCTSLASLPDGFTIPDSVTNVGYMFYNCNNIKTIGNNVSINPSTDNEGAINRNNITSIGTGFSYKTSYTTSISSAQAVFPNATIGAGYHIYQYSDAQ